jgi:energy-coupling factor transporter ATP-binding protein EcfA2
MDSTPIRKGIPDYLWDWAEKKKRLWAKLLVAKIVGTEESLSEKDRREVYELYLNEIGVSSSGGLPTVEKPAFGAASRELALISLSEVKGVNRLAKNMSLEFSKNITVVYGGNGTGKTGYVRILKTLGQSYDAPAPILSDVLDNSPGEPSATVEYELNGGTFKFSWHDGSECDDLFDISVFSNDCVRISIGAHRELLVTPAGFHLFSTLTSELEELTRANAQKIAEYDVELGDWATDLHKATAAAEFVEDLDAMVQFVELKVMSTFNGDDAQKLEKLGARLSRLNKHLLEAEIKTLGQQLTDLKKAIASIDEAKGILTQDALDEIVNSLQALKKLKSTKNENINDIAKRKGIELYDSDVFRRFITSAEEYIQLIEANYSDYEDYPKVENAVCIYCLQRLDKKDSIELLRSYRHILSDDTRGRIAEVTQDIDVAVHAMSEADRDVALHLRSFGEDEDGEAVQPAWLQTYNKKLTRFLDLVASRSLAKLKDVEVKLPFNATRQRLKAKGEEIRKAIHEKSEKVKTLGDREAKMKDEIHELEDKKTLHEHADEAKTLLRNLKTVAKLKSRASTLNTSSVSRQTTKARTDLIAESFQRNFLEEHDRFRRSDIPIQIAFKTDKGESTLVQGVGSGHKLGDVLSDGEQKAIALAEFLTEVRMEDAKAPVVLDDPVTSLDHNIIDAVARRLIEFSRDRQVIVFTHSILLFNAIRQRDNSPSYGDVKFVYYQVSRDDEMTGLLEKNPSSKEERFAYYKARINEGVFNRPTDEKKRLATELAIKGYGLLRSAIEVMVEHDMFKGVVKRYAKNVALMSLERVDGKLIEEHKVDLNAIYERCCMFIEGHSNPDEVAGDPDLSLLKIDFQAIQTIRKDFTK